MNNQVYSWFKALSRIPRGSGNEKAISSFIAEEAKKRGLEVKVDSVHNTVIKKPGTKGYENSKPLILQGHLDMVCEKNKDKEHDFLKDPIELVEKDGWLMANGTTLGADNGIAVAYGLSILFDEEKKLEHPPLEVVFTTSEETGMDGAFALDKDYFHLKAKRLINLDSEREGALTVSCAGGCRVVLEKKIQREVLGGDFTFLHLTLSGLKGGHSGVEIHKGLGNSLDLTLRTLLKIREEDEVRIAHLEGGDKSNAIPRECEAVIAVKNPKRAKDVVNEMTKIFKKELEGYDDALQISLTEAKAVPVFTKDSTFAALALGLLAPNGVRGMNYFIPSLVDVSCNLASVRVIDDALVYTLMIRSGIDSKKVRLVQEVQILSELFNAKMVVDSDYAGWQYQKVSPLRDTAAAVYKKKMGKDVEIEAIHAGLECGIFIEKLGADLDVVAMGPTIEGAHTPGEKLDMASSDRVYDYLLDLLKALK